MLCKKKKSLSDTKQFIQAKNNLPACMALSELKTIQGTKQDLVALKKQNKNNKNIENFFCNIKSSSEHSPFRGSINSFL